jgi:hypothetical protein
MEGPIQAVQLQFFEKSVNFLFNFFLPHIPAFELVFFQEGHLSLLVAKVGCWLPVAKGDLFMTFLDRPPGPDHSRGAVRDLVRVGITTVVDHTAGQVQSPAQQHSRQVAFSIVAGLVALSGYAVEVLDEVKLQKNGSNRKPIVRRHAERTAVPQDKLQN